VITCKIKDRTLAKHFTACYKAKTYGRYHTWTLEI